MKKRKKEKKRIQMQHFTEMVKDVREQKKKYKERHKYSQETVGNRTLAITPDDIPKTEAPSVPRPVSPVNYTNVEIGTQMVNIQNETADVTKDETRPVAYTNVEIGASKKGTVEKKETKKKPADIQTYTNVDDSGEAKEVISPHAYEELSFDAIGTMYTELKD